MNWNRELGFTASLIVSMLILILVPVDDSRVALKRLEQVLGFENELKDGVATRCSELVGQSGTPEEKFLLSRVVTARNPASGATCRLVVQTTSQRRFLMRQVSHFQIAVHVSLEAPFFQKSYQVDFPRPLVFLPIAALILALVFEFELWGMVCLIVSYLLMLSGLNLIQALTSAWKGAVVTFTGSPTPIGLILIALWATIFVSRRQDNPVPLASLKPHEKWLRRLIAAVVGFWNPSAYSLLGRFFYPAKGVVCRVSPFLDSQLLLGCLSLYLLLPETTAIWGLRELTQQSLLLPRYFTFSAVLFLGLSTYSRKARRILPISRSLRVWVALAAVVAVELLTLRWPLLASTPTLHRIGLTLCFTELLFLRQVPWKKVAATFFPLAGAIFVGSFIAVVSEQTGVTDLVLTLASPRLHPHLFVIYTFLTGLALGFLTGDFAASYFTLMHAIKAHEISQGRAALLDGVLAGALFSPFSLFNLTAAVQFRLPVAKIIASRWQSLSFALAISIVLFALGAITSVRILQPVTFVFLCLVALALQLKKRTWRLDSMIIPDYLRPRSTSGSN